MNKKTILYFLIIVMTVYCNGCAIIMHRSGAGLPANLPKSLPNNNQTRPIQPVTIPTTFGKAADLTTFIMVYNKALPDQSAQLIANSILETSSNYQVDYKIITALIAIESSFRPDAKSPTGAIGLGQLTPATATWLNVDNPLDATENVTGCVKLMRRLLDKYNGDINLALAAYKIGSGNVDKTGINQPETIQYIKTIRDVFDRIP